MAIGPYGLSDPKDRRSIAIPAMVIVGTDGTELWRFVSRDYADRMAEDGLIDVLGGLGLPATEPELVRPGNPVPGPRAMPFDQLYPYFRGARFAVAAMAGRHPATGEDAEAFIQQMDRYMDVVKELFKQKRQAEAET